MEHYSALKTNEIITYTTPRINVEDLMLSETSYTQKNKYLIIALIWDIYNRQIHRDRNETELTRGRRGNGKLFFNGYRVSVSDVEKVLEMDSADGWSHNTVCVCTVVATELYP